MKKCLLLLIVAEILTGCTNKNENRDEPEFETTGQLLQAMKSKNDSTWFKHFTFKQNTIFFDTAGQKTDSAMWYESVSYPYFFRIDRDTGKGNYTIYRNDSTYHILADTMYSATADPAVHLVFKGGLYFISLEEAMDKLKKYGFDLQHFRKDTFMDEPVYVIGDANKQFWLHAQDFYCMRRISTNNQNKKTDIVYENFKPLGGGWVEQKVTFFYEGNKRMEEFYLDIKMRDEMNLARYDINRNYKWYLNY